MLLTHFRLSVDIMSNLLISFVLLFIPKLIEGSFRCDYEYSSYADSWFKYFHVPATWEDALLRCALEGATLASPNTPAIKDEMTHIIQYFSSMETEIFTGVHSTFSRGDYFTIEGKPLSKLPLTWAKNEPDNKGNIETCITLNGRGDLADLSCEETRPYICHGSEHNKTYNACGTVDPEYYLDTRTNSCYKFHVVPRNFSRAFFACSAEGGHLAIINSYTESTVLKELFARYPAKVIEGNFWKDVAFIGFHDWNERIEWRTIQGKTLKEAGFSKFSPGEPNNATPGENCGAIYRSGLLIDLWCNKPATFICEKSSDYPPICEAIHKKRNPNIKH